MRKIHKCPHCGSLCLDASKEHLTKHGAYCRRPPKLILARHKPREFRGRESVGIPRNWGNHYVDRGYEELA